MYFKLILGCRVALLGIAFIYDCHPWNGNLFWDFQPFRDEEDAMKGNYFYILSSEVIGKRMSFRSLHFV